VELNNFGRIELGFEFVENFNKSNLELFKLISGNVLKNFKKVDFCRNVSRFSFLILRQFINFRHKNFLLIWE
jgi:hypothetical protein